MPRPANNDPVIVMHDIKGDAQSLIESGAGDIDVLELVNRGFTVWLPNQRGTRYSNVHKRDGEFQFTKRERWNFSYAELGTYDLPAFIDKVRSET